MVHKCKKHCTRFYSPMRFGKRKWLIWTRAESFLYRLLVLKNLCSELDINFSHLISSLVSFSNASLCLFISFVLKHILGSGYYLRHLERTLWMSYCSTKLSKFVLCLFVSQTFPPHVNLIWIISIIKWKNSGLRVTCKGKALCDRQHHGGVDTKSAV